jgi:hypothetical protein
MHTSTTVLNKAAGEMDRKQFLTELGLKWDPFLQPVAEQELAFASRSPSPSPQKEPLPLTHFVQPDNPVALGKSLLTTLRQPIPTFVFGEPGMGKTSLRLALESQYRRVPDGTLIVNYLFGKEKEQLLTAAAHWQRLSEQLAIDAVIQIVEQFNPAFDRPNEPQINALSRLIKGGGRPLQRLAQRIIHESEPERFLGAATLWYSVRRIPVRYVGRSPELQNLLEKALQQLPERSSGWEDLLAAAREWGFDLCLIFADGIDNWNRPPEEMFQTIKPLLTAQASFANNKIYFKWFLPQELNEQIVRFLSSNKEDNVKAPDLITLTWSKEALRRLLTARFAAAASRRGGLSDMAEKELAEELDDLLLAAAQGSPRRLLQLVSALIDVHLETKAGAEKTPTFIDNKQWEQAVQRVEKEWIKERVNVNPKVAEPAYRYPRQQKEQFAYVVKEDAPETTQLSLAAVH